MIATEPHATARRTVHAQGFTIHPVDALRFTPRAPETRGSMVRSTATPCLIASSS